MTRIKMHIFKAKLPFYPPCEVKWGLQNGMSTSSYVIVAGETETKDKRKERDGRGERKSCFLILFNVVIILF